jgi:predicted DNA binding CopG/RHH family protein
VLDIGERGNIFMKKKTIKYKNKSIGKVKVINDFLPRPEDLVLKEETVKVTLSLTKSTVDYFKEKANTSHTQYQKMIRVLLDQYAAHYQH